MNKKEEKKSFIWYFLRGSFIVMISCFLLLITFPPIAALMELNLPEFFPLVSYIFIILFCASLISTFIFSIICLKKYEKKTFPIVALVISSIFIVFILLGVYLLLNIR
jgi:hypothetical protein